MEELRSYKNANPKPLRLTHFAGIISNVGEKKHASYLLQLCSFSTTSVRCDLNIGIKEVFFMATNCDFGRSSLILEQYQREMDIIAVALQEESQDEREERLSLVTRSWSLTNACFHAQLETSDVPTYVSSVAFARP
jgi:hypothetical protein